MKKSLIAALITTATIATTASAQPPIPNANGMQPPPPPPAPPAGQLQQVSQFKGNIVKMNTNDDYVYDGCYIVNTGDSLLVKFPPHLGAQIVPLVQNGASVTISGIIDSPPFGVKEIRMVSLTANGKTVYDTPPATPPVPGNETFVNGGGKITAIQRDPAGNANGCLLDNNIILRMPPFAMNQLSNAVQNGATVSYTGTKKQAQPGEVTSGNYTIVHCSTITVNGQQYLVQ